MEQPHEGERSSLREGGRSRRTREDFLGAAARAGGRSGSMRTMLPTVHMDLGRGQTTAELHHRHCCWAHGQGTARRAMLSFYIDYIILF